MAFLGLRRTLSVSSWKRLAIPRAAAPSSSFFSPQPFSLTVARTLCEGSLVDGPTVMEATHISEPEPDPPNKYHEPVALVTGASRGLGLEFTRQLLTKYPGQVVYGTARNPDICEPLQALRRRHYKRCELATMDVTKEESVQAVAQQIADKYGRLDLIVHCAGVLHIPGVMEPEAILSKCNPENLMRAFEVNAVGSIVVAKHFWDLLKIGKGTNTGRAGAVIAYMSNKVSSIKENTLAGWYGYRASKTALNMLVRTMSLEAMSRRDPVMVMLLHPGTVNTEHSRAYASTVPNMKLFSPDYAVERLLGIINKVRPEDNGKFTSWDRQEVTW